MRATKRASYAVCCVLVLAVGAFEAKAEEPSTFGKPRAAVKAEISKRFGCSWRPYLDASEQCGDGLVVIDRDGRDAVESVELTCPIQGEPRQVAGCKARALWLVGAFLPSWTGRRQWVAAVFRSPPKRDRFIQTKVAQATVVAEAEGPADLPLTNIIIGMTRGDPDQWDLPRPGATPSPAPPSPPAGRP